MDTTPIPQRDVEKNKTDTFVDSKTDSNPEGIDFNVHGYTDEDAREIAEGVHEAGVIDPHKGEENEEIDDLQEEVDRIRKADQVL